MNLLKQVAEWVPNDCNVYLLYLPYDNQRWRTNKQMNKWMKPNWQSFGSAFHFTSLLSCATSAAFGVFPWMPRHLRLNSRERTSYYTKPILHTSLLDFLFWLIFPHWGEKKISLFYEFLLVHKSNDGYGFKIYRAHFCDACVFFFLSSKSEVICRTV